MKALIITPYYAPRVGGLENYARAMADGLVAAGWEVVVSFADPDVTTMTSEDKDGYTIYRLPIWKIISNTPIHIGWPGMIKRIISAESPDVINVHAPVPSMALSGAVVAGRIPVVMTYHAGSMKKGSLITDLVIGIYESVALPYMLRKSTAIICASDFVRNTFLNRWHDKTVTITPGVDWKLFKPSDRLAIAGELIFIGDFRDPRKGLDVLLKAVKLLPKVELRVVGEGIGKPQTRVTYTGVKRGQDLVDELQRAQVLVLPSTTDAESFGMVLIEAMACGLAVIGSKVGGVGLVIKDGENGLLVEPGNVTELVRAIKKLMDDPETAARMGHAARKYALNDYAWQSRIAATSRVLEQAVKYPNGEKLEAHHVS